MTTSILPDQTLQKRQILPVKLAPVELKGKHVRLEPLNVAQHVEGLFAVSQGQPIELNGRSLSAYDPDELIWRYMSAGPFSHVDEMSKQLQTLVDNPNGLAMCVIDTISERPVGVATYMNNYPEHLKVELGNIWYSPIVQRTNANTESTYLMLKHAFDLGYRRVEWKCDAKNERSRRAALRMGFTFEGVQECHFIIKNRNRDTAWFRILDREWSAVKAHLEQLLQS